MNLEPLGYQALIDLYNLQVIPHYRASYVSMTGGRRTYTEKGQEIHIYPKDYQIAQPEDPLFHLEFALKHEGMNLLILRVVFEHLTESQLAKYINSHAQGKPQRKIWYLFEFLMHQQLPIQDLSSGNYIRSIGSKALLYGKTN